MNKWYHPPVTSNVELCLYDPRPSKALLTEVTYGQQPWAAMSVADVEVECDYHLLRRIKDKALNLATRLDKSQGKIAKLGTATEKLHTEDIGPTDDLHYLSAASPVSQLSTRLKLIANL